VQHHRHFQYCQLQARQLWLPTFGTSAKHVNTVLESDTTAGTVGLHSQNYVQQTDKSIGTRMIEGTATSGDAVQVSEHTADTATQRGRTSSNIDNMTSDTINVTLTRMSNANGMLVPHGVMTLATTRIRGEAINDVIIRTIGVATADPSDTIGTESHATGTRVTDDLVGNRNSKPKAEHQGWR
jgi:hypothetical protein